MTKTKSTVVERDVFQGAYGITAQRMIVDHPKHGRLYLAEGFGGVGSLSGGTYRWRHGFVCRLLPTDTLDTLDEVDRESVHGEATLSMMTHGFDVKRPILEWDGSMIERLAKSVENQEP